MYRRTSNLFVRISVYNKLTHKIQQFHEGKNLNTTWMELDNDFIVPLALVFLPASTPQPKDQSVYIVSLSPLSSASPSAIISQIASVSNEKFIKSWNITRLQSKFKVDFFPWSYQLIFMQVDETAARVYELFARLIATHYIGCKYSRYKIPSRSVQKSKIR